VNNYSAFVKTKRPSSPKPRSPGSPLWQALYPRVSARESWRLEQASATIPAVPPLVTKAYSSKEPHDPRRLGYSANDQECEFLEMWQLRLY